MSEIKARHLRRWRQVATLLGACFILYLLHLILAAQLFWHKEAGTLIRQSWFSEPSLPKEVLTSLGLNEKQCIETFPGLFKDIDDTVKQGPFTLTPSGEMGPLQVKLNDGQLHIIKPKRTEPLSPELRDSQTSALHQLHRAIMTSPSPLPDTIIGINIQDQPFGAAFSYSRPAYAAPTANNPPITRAFLMPHFSFWAWPLPFIGSFPRAAAAVDGIEAGLPFSRKTPRAVWRGTRRFIGSHNPHLRQDLLNATRNAAWADVQALAWEGDEAKATMQEGYATNALPIEDFCRYKYVLYTEGITYSGRLQFLQMCNSVLLTPPLAWLQHTTHLIKPVFSHDLNPEAQGRETWSPSSGVQEAWPTHYRPDQANAVFVAPDWSDLGDTIRWLEDHPAIAEGIARRQRSLFVGQGYFSPAAEACYWRALIRGWSKVVQTDYEEWKDIGQVRWEQFVLGYTK